MQCFAQNLVPVSDFRHERHSPCRCEEPAKNVIICTFSFVTQRISLVDYRKERQRVEYTRPFAQRHLDSRIVAVQLALVKVRTI